MTKLYELQSQLLRDKKITNDEVGIIREYICEDNKLDMDDVRFLIELLSEADEVCPEFDELFFPVLKGVILQDGRIDTSEQFYLLKMLYSDGHVRDSEKRFLEELREEADELTPEFESLCATALTAAATDWDVGGE